MKINKSIINQVESLIGYQFVNTNLLIEALTHKSFCILDNKNISHNERLEYLGDAILGMVTADFLMVKFPMDEEGALSKKRASVINQETLADKALKMKIDEFLILGPGEKAQGSHLKPRLLASAFEAIIGAIYLDSDFLKIKNWIEFNFQKDISEIKPEMEYEKDYKTRLQELVFKLKLSAPVYELISTAGPSHDPEFLISLKISGEEKSRASGKSKKMAEQKAAQIYINQLSIKQENKR